MVLLSVASTCIQSRELIVIFSETFKEIGAAEYIAAGIYALLAAKRATLIPLIPLHSINISFASAISV